MAAAKRGLEVSVEQLSSHAKTESLLELEYVVKCFLNSLFFVKTEHQRSVSRLSVENAKLRSLVRAVGTLLT